jgi:hypothetical protein
MSTSLVNEAPESTVSKSKPYAHFATVSANWWRFATVR